MSEKKLGRNDPCWCGSQKKYKHCHMDFDEKIDHFRREGHTVPKRAMIKTPEQSRHPPERKINIAVLDLVHRRFTPAGHRGDRPHRPRRNRSPRRHSGPVKL